MRITALAVALVTLSGCDSYACPNGSIDDCKAQKAVQIKLDKPIWGVSAQHDDLRRVTCWVTDDSRGGLSCLPDWMLKKPEVKP